MRISMKTSKIINVLHLRSCRGTGGGPEKTILFSVREADPESFRLHVAYLKSRDDTEFDLAERAQNLGIDDFVTIEEDHKFDVRALKSLHRVLRERKIDILSCHCYKSDLYGLILSRFHPMKLVTTAHGPLASFQFFRSAQNWRVRYIYDQLDLMLLRYFDQVLIVSDSMRKAVARFGVPDSKIIWVKNSIDSTYFQRPAERSFELRDQLGIPRNAIVVGAVGRLNAEKDYPNFFDAARILLADRPELYFTIAGNGPLEELLQDQVRSMGLSNRVLFLGHFHDVRQVYAMMDVYVLSSTREGLPNAVLEAMALEVPIVATDVDGVREAVVHEREALLVPARDPKRLAEGVRSILDDPTLATLLSRAAREKVVREFSFASRMRHVEDIYRRLLSGGGRSGSKESQTVAQKAGVGPGAQTLCPTRQAASLP
jgi:glycosyltransferase involved in cell wall biosynthesis